MFIAKKSFPLILQDLILILKKLNTKIMTFHPERYFDLKLFNHPKLFEKATDVWEALGFLKEYFSLLTLGSINSSIPSQSSLVNPETIYIGEQCTIEPGCYIEGPCYIEDHCHIAHGAYVRPYSLICSGSKVGHCSEVKHSIMFPKSKAPHFNYVGDSILGHRVNLGAGVVLANYKLNGSKVSIKFKAESLSTDFTKLGAILGDDSFIGCNSVLNPGTLLDKEFKCQPLSLLKGVLESHTKTLLS